jgi:hypothetical protein
LLGTFFSVQKLTVKESQVLVSKIGKFVDTIKLQGNKEKAKPSLFLIEEVLIKK